MHKSNSQKHIERDKGNGWESKLGALKAYSQSTWHYVKGCRNKTLFSLSTHDICLVVLRNL
jgi:hypothetical protein